MYTAGGINEGSSGFLSFLTFVFFWQDEEGVDGDAPLDVSELSTNFQIKPKPSENAAGIALIAVSIS